MSNLSNNLAYLLTLHGLNSNQLQEKAGITQSTTSRILSGKIVSPSPKVINQYADFFGVSAPDLIYSDLTNKPIPCEPSNTSLIDFICTFKEMEQDGLITPEVIRVLDAILAFAKAHAKANK